MIITKYQQFNEGIRHLLVGPTKEEVWKNKGYSDIMKTPPDTAKEFLEMILDDITIVNQRKYRKSVFYKRNGEIYFELEHNNQTLWVNYSKVWLVLVNYYGLTGWDLTNIISKITQKKLKWPNFNIKESDRLPDGFWESIYELGEKNDRELNESIKHLLVGPTEDEVIDNLNRRYENGEIDIAEYLVICVKCGFIDLIEEIVYLEDFDGYNLQYLLSIAVTFKQIDVVKLVLSYGLKKELVEGVEIYKDTPIEIKNIIKNYLEQ
jgi:hypothetical protein